MGVIEKEARDKNVWMEKLADWNLERVGSTIFAPVQLARLAPNSLNACHISNNPH